jgi:predicted RNA-binding Zn-ribbon protein involved in translation (DUF1610 family)
MSTANAMCTSAKCDQHFMSGETVPNFCPKCGKNVIEKCPECGKAWDDFESPSSCKECGALLRR